MATQVEMAAGLVKMVWEGTVLVAVARAQVEVEMAVEEAMTTCVRVEADGTMVVTATISGCKQPD